MTRAAIVTTLRDAAATLPSFVAYHRAIGFAHFFLFFDDPADPMLAWARAQADVTAIPRDDALRAAWREMVLWPQAGPYVDTEVMARQILNAAYAMDLARAQGLAWLLHIDADELFYSPRETAAVHFAALTATEIEVATYANYEGVPETEDTEDFFRTVTLFKRPITAALSPAAQALIARAGQSAECFFHFYSNGKSAVRLAAPGLQPATVHVFARNGQTTMAGYLGPYILHYPCCGFAAFRQKYVTLGRFADKWWGQVDIAQAVGPFHPQARDAVMDAVDAGDDAGAREFYQTRMMITDPKIIADMTERELLERITGPREILATL